jgi:hypothetical protein
LITGDLKLGIETFAGASISVVTAMMNASQMPFVCGWR